VREVIDQSYARAKGILKEHEPQLHKMAAALIKFETIDNAQIKDIMVGREPKPPADWSDIDPPQDDGNEKAKAEDKPKSSKGEIGGPANQH